MQCDSELFLSEKLFNKLQKKTHRNTINDKVKRPCGHFFTLTVECKKRHIKNPK